MIWDTPWEVRGKGNRVLGWNRKKITFEKVKLISKRLNAGLGLDISQLYLEEGTRKWEILEVETSEKH